MIIKQDSSWKRVMQSMNYKPEYYAAYFIYCLIPVVCYIWYLSRCAKEDKVY